MSALSVVFLDIGNTLIRRDDDVIRILVQGAFDAIQGFNDRGILTGIISNTGNLSRDELVDFLPADFDFGVFEPTLVILSSDPNVGVEKPDPAIYELALDRARLLMPSIIPAACLFCGENLTEVMAAQRVGFLGARVFPTERGTELTELLTMVF